jgi:hypothetical protein
MLLSIAALGVLVAVTISRVVRPLEGISLQVWPAAA